MSTILVIDDEKPNRDYLQALLGPSGHHVVEAADGEEGLQKMRAERPDLVIADLLMPTMDGFEFVRRLRADPGLARTDVVFFTAAYHEHEVRALAGECGVTRILTKPAEPQTILDLVNASLGIATTVAGPAVQAPVPAVEFDREHLRLLTDKLSQKVADLEAMNQRHAALVDLGLALATQVDPGALLETVCRSARELLGAKYALVGVGDAGHGPRLLTGGMNPDTAAAVSADPSFEPGGPIGGQLRQGRPCRLHDQGPDPEAAGLPRAHPAVRSLLAAPITGRLRTFGYVILTDRLAAVPFGEADERLLLSIAAQAGVALENLSHAIDLEAQIRARTDDLRRSNAELEQFATVASHDLQEPLRKIIGFSRLLAEGQRGRLGDEADGMIARIVDGATRMQELIQDLLTYSRVSRRPERGPVDCNASVTQALHNLQGAIEESGAEVACDPLPTVPGSDWQLVQLFQNLIGNALKFRGGRPPRVRVSAVPSGAAIPERPPEGWMFSVRDNGIGIEPRFHERIFGIFERLHSRMEYSGTGIGLAICRKIVDRHGGRIWVESSPGEGSTFFFTLPPAGATAAVRMENHKGGGR